MTKQQNPKTHASPGVKRLEPARMNNIVKLLAGSLLFIGLSGFVVLVLITGSLNGWWGVHWGLIRADGSGL